MSEVRKEIINRLTKLVDQRKNLAGEIKYDNCIVSTTDLDFLLNMINEDSYIPKQKIKYKINENSNMIREIEEKIIKEEKSGDICEEYLSDLYKEKSLIERDIVTLRELLQESEDK